jgi:hypothetical protein
MYCTLPFKSRIAVSIENPQNPLQQGLSEKRLIKKKEKEGKIRKNKEKEGKRRKKKEK